MKEGTGKNLLLGTGAGVLGTVLMQGMLEGSKRWMPQTIPPLKDDPGHFMIQQGKRLLPPAITGKIPSSAETAAARALAFGYGCTFAAAYGAVRKQDINLLLDGTALGLLTWAAGYLGWLPASRLMPPIWKQPPRQVLPNMLSHVLFGVASIAAFRWFKRRL